MLVYPFSLYCMVLLIILLIYPGRVPSSFLDDNTTSEETASNSTSCISYDAQVNTSEEDFTRSPCTTILKDWSDYYQYRGWDLDRPDAAVLSAPLSIYYIFTTLLPEHVLCK